MRYQPSHLRKLLSELGIHPSKRLSQNFLIDGNIVRKIVQFAGVQKGDHVLEIGPGPGALTEALLAAGAQVTAIEKDPRMIQLLSSLPRLKVQEADILNYEIPKSNWKVVANLPYHITTPVLAHLIEARDRIQSITVMVQKEVAERFRARPKSKDYSSFSVFLQFYADVHFGFVVSPTCFFPAPKVHSAVVRLDLRSPPPVSSEKRFFELVRAAFGKRRKMLRSNLKEITPHAEQCLENIGIRGDARAEDLSVLDFVALFKEIEQHQKKVQT
ncbi:MAG: 16S rRNA (adenine(1518)-N(6)/adenine(1519)-N(6))-dimethyltransferase RsmA [Verrucomicrobia bacterium]|nr:16S rRNA (adenine(1518)-N(6)/adenine(1519)-N(6))-dimethyltransferase RsmA [Verrucomicrobiota bacterium]